ncbi:4Fe-4S dicluster domain-containing protein [Cohnella abietis]|uniref:Ferredoxin n=1 Tax=Cohnella abietis TaxID=2507935 RepID=A0A3T1D5I1_9BACL|nr:ferredoxin family protein [Cohnella abietis]BBI33351.1 ferredoxin [Cohnella abietis]
MIQIISQERCVGCDWCIKVCPTDVFDKKDGFPVIARVSDCQTCYMCELYCPTNAMYVSPLIDEEEEIDEQALIENSIIGSYRKEIGWGKGLQSTASRDQFHLLNLINSNDCKL